MTTTVARPALSPHADLEFAPAIAGPVLLATDGTDGAYPAALAARCLAERLDTRVDVVAVLHPLPAAVFTADVPPVPLVPPEFEAERVDRLRADVSRQLESVLGPPEQWHLDVQYGPIGRTIADVARARRSGIVVVGSGGHRLRDRLVGEEVSLQVVRHASCPVLAVDRRFRRLPRRAVVAVDFSAASVRAALGALAMLDGDEDGGARLTLVHVRSPFEGTYPILGSWASEYDSQIGDHFARLRDLLHPHMPHGVTLEMRTRVGAVPATVLEIADEVGARLIAVGTHGPGWVERLFVGSVATATLRSAGRAVLVTPAPSARERVRLELGVFGATTLEKPDDWAGALDAFTRRNAGRPARLEVGDASSPGASPAVHDYRFRGATYDPHDERVELMLEGPGGGTTHLTHTASRVRSIEIVSEDNRVRDRSLVIEDHHGFSVLTLGGDASAWTGGA